MVDKLIPTKEEAQEEMESLIEGWLLHNSIVEPFRELLKDMVWSKEWGLVTYQIYQKFLKFAQVLTENFDEETERHSQEGKHFYALYAGQMDR